MSTQVHSGPGRPTSETGEPNSQVVVVGSRSTSDRALLRMAAVAIPIGIVVQILMEALHPSNADPNDSAAVFQEYAALTLGPSCTSASSSPPCWSPSHWSHSPGH